MPTLVWLVRLVPVCLAAMPDAAFAHASEQALVLLLPTDIYSAVGTAIVALTAVLLYATPSAVLDRLFTPTRIDHDVIREHAGSPTASLVTAGALLLLLVAGFAGSRDPLRNPLPLAIWTVFWIAAPLLHAAFGDLWRYCNPWSALLRSTTGRAPDAPGLASLPPAFGIWPATLSLIGITAFALADPAPADPERLAVIVAIYWLGTFCMMLLFGEREWLARGEGLALLFRMFATLCPLRRSPGGMRIAMPGHRLVNATAPTFAMAVSCLVLLGCGSFDGLHETFRWLALIDVNPLAFPGRSALIGRTLSGLAAVLVLVVLLFFFACWLGARLADTGSARTLPGAQGAAPGALELLRSLAPAVLPIAVGYHFAHYLTSFMVDAQYAFIAVSDPFGRGQDLFGTAQRQVTTGFFNSPASVRTIWLVQAGAVVAGHVLAVLVSHARASALFDRDAARARRAHLPMVVLMLGYTLFGLWLLASPRGA